jgi:hypothetical protein
MRAFLLPSVISLLASSILPASGSVIYTFNGVTAGFFEVPVSLVYTAPDFITRSTPIPESAFSSCACHNAAFIPGENFGQGPGSILDALSVLVSTNGEEEGGLFVFATGTFATYGTYTSRYISLSPFTVAGPGTLMVADASSGVPEPGTGAAVLLAFAVCLLSWLHRARINL